jgi:tetratricopeptide (TPR) repeat protein
MAECLELRKALIALPDATAFDHASLVYDARVGKDETLAARVYADARERFPDDDVLPLNAGWSYIATGRGGEALAEFQSGIRLRGEKPGGALLRLGIAAAQWLAGAKEAAVGAFGEAVTVNPDLGQEKALEAMEWTQEEWQVVNAVRIDWGHRQPYG